MADPIRKEALGVLCESDSMSRESVDDAIRRHPEWSALDRAFYTALVETTLDWLVTIDAVIAAYSKTRIRKLHPVVRCAIELALAQILYMDRVPDHAACDESVKLVRKSGQTRYAGFVNGIIRNVIRERDALRARIQIDGRPVRLMRTDDGGWKVTDRRDMEYERLCNLSLAYSYPYWIVRHFETSYGDAEGILKGLRSQRRIHALVRTPGNFTTVEVEDPEEFIRSEEFHNGEYYIMDLSSMMPVYAAGHDENGNRDEEGFADRAEVLDLCASPGGKSVEAAILYDASVTSCDVSPRKTQRIQENVRRMHLESNISVQVNDATVFNPAFADRYDVVIADVPCSGLGVSGRKPDIRRHITEEGMSELADIQKRIIDNATGYVKKGGTLIYSTCTLNPAENEDQVRDLTARHPEFSIRASQTIYPDPSHDGFYYAILRR